MVGIDGKCCVLNKSTNNSDAPVIKQEKKKERIRTGTVLLVIFSILFGVSTIGVIVCIALIVFDIQIP